MKRTRLGRFAAVSAVAVGSVLAIGVGAAGATSMIYDVDGDGYYDAGVQDTTGDGYYDRNALDTDGDGHYDFWILDQNQDWYVDQVIVDATRDGWGDTFFYDSDQNDVFEAVWVDTNADGYADAPQGGGVSFTIVHEPMPSTVSPLSVALDTIASAIFDSGSYAGPAINWAEYFPLGIGVHVPSGGYVSPTVSLWTPADPWAAP